MLKYIRKIFLKNSILLLIISIFLIMLTGCWDALDIDKKNIVTAVIIDKAEEGFTFYVEIASLGKSKNDNGGSPKSISLKGEGITFATARDEINRKSDKPIYLSGDQAVIFTQAFAEYGVEEYAYRIRQIPEYRKTIKIVLTQDDPSELIKLSERSKELLGLSIEYTLETLKSDGKCIHLTLSDLLEALASPYKSYVMPVIGEDDQTILIKGYSVFYQSKTVGFIPAENAVGLIMLKAKKPKASLVVPYNDVSYTIEVNIKKKTYVASYENGKTSFKVKLKCEAFLLYMSQSIPVTDEISQGLSIELNKLIEKIINDAIIESQQGLRIDYLEFYTSFRIKYPNIIKNLDWFNEYPNASISVEADVNLDTGGKIDLNPKTND